MSIEEVHTAPSDSENPELALADADDALVDDEAMSVAAEDMGLEVGPNRASGEVMGTVGAYNAQDINTEAFDELHLDGAMAQEVQEAWAAFVRSAGSKDAAGEAIYGAMYDAAPSLAPLWKTPRAVLVVRLFHGMNQIFTSVHTPKELKTIVEAVGFLHLHLEVTVPRVAVFRDAILDLLQAELGEAMSPLARTGFGTVFNYAGGAFVYVRVKYSERLGCLAASWAQASGKQATEVAEADGEEDPSAEQDAAAEIDASKAKSTKSTRKKRSWLFGGISSGASSSGKGTGSSDATDIQNTSVPKTYNDMFNFNAAVMGFGSRTWMQEVLTSFDNIVTHASNAARLQEECDILSLKIAKCKGSIVLSEYKAVMLASLRSLVKDWGSLHEVSWSWLWENVERLLKSMMGKLAKQEVALNAFLNSLDEAAKMTIRNEVYAKFFAMAPAGQDFFKQSTTRLHFLADKWMVMTLDMYREPKRMVDELSGLGLRHVAYSVPADLFGPFVSAAVQTVRMLASDDFAEESFRWSMSLIS
eukprot:CAMPEP_0176041224 /NCGR_PEP_ID=MMETSP0120_2-20121206/20446_1 /TAXON_ID=160619 /ORGANISM="Kryptoperidinium foliaceum, Strain CCMP 1326" /LENGTH=529 /DNA_ID=CAMNT_0017374625 /DNA_START=30 /DNA_END=1616 /DNA_ORIENTATION=-